MLTLEERIERLERSGRRWRGCTMALLGVGLLAGIVAAAAPPEAERQLVGSKLVIVGEDGKPAFAVASKKGVNAMQLFGPDGKAVFNVGVTPGGVVLSVNRADGAAAFSVAATEKEGNKLGVNGAEGKMFFIASQDEKGDGRLTLYNKDHSAKVWEAPAKE